MKNLFVIGLLFCSTSLSAQMLPYQNPQLTSEERAKDLVSRLTLEEKAILMCDESEAIPRMGIKRFVWWSEALHGVANQGDVTVFPEPVGMAASFNDDLLFNIFDAVSDEMRAKHNDRVKKGLEDQRFYGLSVWTPNVNIFRDPRWGRGQETYGEDPFLSSKMGVAVVKGLQGPQDAKYRKLLACAKHYAVHSGPEYTRHSVNLNDINPRDLWETYLPAFKDLVQKSDVRQVMCAYQRLDDEPCCGNTRLLQQILRDEWGYKHMVVSDCGAISDFWSSHKSSSDAIHAAVKGSLSGTDVECGYGYAYMKLPDAVKKDLVKEKDIDKNVIRLMTQRFELGEMDDPSIVPWSKIPMSIINCKKHKELTLDMARQSMVLLQNKDNILPLSKNIKKVAVIGPNADDKPMMWGNYNGTPFTTITILDGIKSKLGNKKIVYDKACSLIDDQVLISLLPNCSFDGKKGIKGTFWNNQNMEGESVSTIQIVDPINVSTYGNHSFAPKVNLLKFSGRYQTVLTSSVTEDIVFRIAGASYWELFVDGKSIKASRSWRDTEYKIPFKVEKGKKYNIELRYAQIETYNANLKFDLGRELPLDYKASINKLKDVDVVVFVGGISPQLEGEEMPINLPGFKGGDRTDIELPAVQRTFLKELKAAGKKVIFINCSGSAMGLVPETESCDAILQAWYSGEQGGNAVADILFGDYNPSGKLPVTFYKSISQLPDYEDYSMKGRTYRYMSDPLYQFGYGLSYTDFQIGKAGADKSKIKDGDSIKLTLPVKNIGKRAGTEIVQIYIKKISDTNGPLKSLKGYKRVTLKPGEEQNIEIVIPASSFECFDEKSNTMCVTPGEYKLMYGNSSADKDLQTMNITLM
ncbi:xylan 1,4-beta-xylosidase [Phocaeicola paurosaccharolyticus]|uniref:xylan 1,4-beta-xylosidase n=1 Tax=Phocaeicola paurosaccharolyticus TaxID=732242 RepID=UPI002FDF70F2